MLWAEFRRCQVDFHCFQRSVIDIQDLYHRFEPRDLATAIQKYLGRSFNPHADALAVTQACSDLLNAQLAIHPELPESVAGLAAYPQRVDPQGFFHVGDGRHLFASGRYRGRTVDEVAELNPHYLRSLLGDSLEWTARFAIEKALQRVTDSPKPSVDLLRTGEPGNSPDPTSD
jgi:DNA polymerase-3 subunit epsilon